MSKDYGIVVLLFFSLITGALIFLGTTLPYGYEFFSSSLIAIGPGLSYGLGLFVLFVKERRDTPNYLFKGIFLIILSIIGFVAAYQISIFASAFAPFLGALIGCYVGSFILAISIGRYWDLSKRKVNKIGNWGGILGFILCVPLSLAVLKGGFNNQPGWQFDAVIITTWQLVMAFVIVKTIHQTDQIPPAVPVSPQ